MNIKLFSTAPHSTDTFWQIVIVPTISVLRNNVPEGAYTVCSVEWLFWSLTFVINDIKRSKTAGIC